MTFASSLSKRATSAAAAPPSYDFPAGLAGGMLWATTETVEPCIATVLTSTFALYTLLTCCVVGSFDFDVCCVGSFDVGVLLFGSFDFDFCFLGSVDFNFCCVVSFYFDFCMFGSFDLDCAVLGDVSLSSAVLEPVLISLDDALLPKRRFTAFMIIDLPAPVSPLRMESPSVKVILKSSMIAKFLIPSSQSMLFKHSL